MKLPRHRTRVLMEAFEPRELLSSAPASPIPAQHALPALPVARYAIGAELHLAAPLIVAPCAPARCEEAAPERVTVPAVGSSVEVTVPEALPGMAWKPGGGIVVVPRASAPGAPESAPAAPDPVPPAGDPAPTDSGLSATSSLSTQPGAPALTAPGAALSNATATEIDLAGVAPTGGTGSYTYQWYRSTSAVFTPSAGTALAGAKALSLADTSGLAADTPYFYILGASDGYNTTYSPLVIGGLAIPTVPIALPYQVGPVLLAYLGSSTWAINQGSGQVPTLIDGTLHGQYPPTMTTYNGAASGTNTTNFLPGQPSNLAIKNAVTGFSGYRVLRMMIGSNDAALGRPASQWLTNMQSIIQDALTWGVDQVVLEEIGVRLDGGAATLDLIRQYNAARGSLTSLSPKVVLGTACTFENQAIHIGQLSSDKVHQTNAGQLDLAANQSVEVGALFAAPTALNVGASQTGVSISMDASHTVLQVSAAPGGALMYQYLASATPSLAINLLGTGQSVSVNLANGTPATNLSITGTRSSQDSLSITGQSGSQYFTFNDAQFVPVSGGSISYQGVSNLYLYSGTYQYAGNFTGFDFIDLGAQATVRWF